MVDINFIDKLNLIYEFIKSNSLIFLVLLLIIVMLMDLLYGKNKHETKILYVILIILMLFYTLFSYYKPLLNIIDVYIENIFKLVYFPSIIEYFSMLLITILIQIISFRRSNKVLKNINLWIGILIESLFIINIMAMKDIKVDLNTITRIYENNLLLSIFQVSSIIFMVWIIINILTYIVSLYVIDRIEMPKLNDYE